MSESRPINCREALREAGKAYPRSGCSACHKGGLHGCPYEIKNLKEQSSETSIAANPKPQFKLKIVYSNNAGEVIEISASTLGGLAWALNQNQIYNSQKDTSREVHTIEHTFSEGPTPITDAEWQTQCCSGASWYRIAEKMKNRAADLERKLAEALVWKHMLSIWGGTPEIVNSFIKGQQERIHAAQEAENQRDALADTLEIIASGGRGQFRWSMTKAELFARKTLAAVKGGEG